jgi:hypothetical protein
LSGAVPTIFAGYDEPSLSVTRARLPICTTWKFVTMWPS